MLPEHFPHQTTYAWFTRFRDDDGTWQAVNHHLLMLIAAGREASPSAAISDSQSVKTTEDRRSAWL